MSKDADMYARRIEQEQIADRYVLGSLDVSEAEAFERHCLEHPEAVAEYEISRALADGMRAAPVGEVNWFDRYPVGLAAGILLSVSVALNSWFYIENQNMKSTTNSYVSDTITFEKVIAIEPTRGDPQTIQIPLQDPALLRIAVGPMGFDKYALVVRDQNNVAVLNRSGLSLDEDFNVYLNYAGLLRAASTYTLTVEGVGEKRIPIAEYRLITV